jgi:uncharacterized protein YfaA (DUF2138 family)
MGYTNQYGTAGNANAHATGRAYPTAINSEFNKVANGQYQYGDAYFVDQVFADEFLQVGIALKKGKPWLFGVQVGLVLMFLRGG